ncbi:hypothetical protein SMICM304S_10141 [Streptomyces microflavus]
MLDAPGRVHDGPQPGGGGEDTGGERGRAPAGDEQLRPGERGRDPGLRIGQPVGDQRRVGVHERGEPLPLYGGEEAFRDAGAHGEKGLGSGHLTLPAVRPAFQCRWSTTKATISGVTASREPVTTIG